MSLYKNLVSVPVTGGIDTKTTSKLVESGFFLSLQNTVRRKLGAIEKRFGFSSLGNLDTDGNVISSGQRLDNFFNDLVLINNESLYSYLSATNSWRNRGTVVPTSVTAKSVVSSTGKSVMADCAYMDGMECYVWEDSRGGIRCSLINRDTGSAIIADTVVTPTGSRPKVIAIASTFCITFIDGTDFKVRRITSGEPTTLQTEQVIENTATDNPYDLTTYGELGVFAYNAASTIRVGYLLPSGVVGSLTTASADPYVINNRGRDAINIVSDPDHGLIYVFFHDVAGTLADDLHCQILDVTLLDVDDVDIEVNVANVRNISGAVQASGIVTVYYEVSAASASNHFVRNNSVIRAAGSTVVGTAASFKRSVGLSAKAFLVNDTIYVPLVHQSPLQSTYFIAKSSGFIVTRMQGSTAAGLTASSATPAVLRSGLSRVIEIDDERVVALSVINRLVTVDSTTASGFVGVSRQAIFFNSSQFDTAVLGNNFHIAGGVLLDYDGVRTVEHGFHLYPETVTSVASNGAGTLTVSGTYRFKVVYEWVDAQGQIHRSAPSVAVSQVMGAADDTITVTAPALRLTDKSNVRIVVYRTKWNDTTVYYRDADAANTTSSDTVSIVLTNPDTTIATQEILYTVGGTLDNIAPPAAIVVHAHNKDRLFLCGTENGDIWYSRSIVKGEGVNFSDGFVIRLANVTAAESLDDKVIFFQERAIFSLVGSGPTDTGAQNDFLPPQQLPGDVGCTNQKSLVSTPIGLMFKSAKGIYLLDRALNQKYIGDRVEDFNHLEISSAVLLKDNNEVRFTTTDGVCLVYNYDSDEWSTFTNYEAVSAAEFLNTYCHLTADGTVNQEIENQFNDNGVIYSMRIETNWFKFAKLQGFQRIYNWALLGDFVSHHITRVKIAYDSENYYSDPVYFNTEDGLGTETYGTGNYGDESPYGGSGSSTYQFRSKPYKQKCQSIKLVIDDLDTLSPSGGGSFKLVAISFLVGSKQGMFKMGESKTRG